jgi:hypothetical protein
MKPELIKKIATAMFTMSILLVLVSTSHAFDKDEHQAKSLVSPHNSESDNPSNPSSTPNSSVTLDFSVNTGESWDIKGNSTNVMENCFQGDVITGLEWNNVQLQTVGDSFLSEATIKFSDSSGSGGVELSVGFGSEFSGTQSFSSDGIFDLSDNFVSDVLSLADKQFFVEFFELVDDSANQVDARYTSGTITIWGTNLSAKDDCPFINGKEPVADLQVDISSDAAPTRTNTHFEVQLDINNIGSLAATNVQASLNFPRQVDFVSSTCDDGSTGSLIESVLQFDLQDIEAASSTSCTIELILTRYGSFELQANTSADNDTNSLNDSSTIGMSGAAYIIPTLNIWGLLTVALAMLFFGWHRNRVNRVQSS